MARLNWLNRSTADAARVVPRFSLLLLFIMLLLLLFGSFYRVNRAEILLMAICALRSCEIIHCILFQRTLFKANAISICLFTYLHLSGYPKKRVHYTTKFYYTQKTESSICKVNKTTYKYRILYLKNVKIKTTQKQLRNAVGNLYTKCAKNGLGRGFYIFQYLVNKSCVVQCSASG